MAKPLDWKINAGRSAKPRNPDRMVWIRWMAKLPDGSHEQTRAPVRAGNFNWLHRGLLYDIHSAAAADEG